MEMQKIVNLLSSSDNQNPKFGTKSGMLLTAKRQVLIQKMSK